MACSKAAVDLPPADGLMAAENCPDVSGCTTAFLLFPDLLGSFSYLFSSQYPSSPLLFFGL